MMKARLLIALVSGLLAASLASAQTRVQVGHFAPFAATLDGTSVTIRVNGADTLNNVRFGDFTPSYLSLPGPGSYRLDVVPTGSSTVAITATVNLAANTDYTVLAIGDGQRQPLELLALTDDNSAPTAGNLKLRVVHAAPFASTIDGTRVSVRTDAGAVVGGLTNVPFKGASGYLSLPAATYNLKVATIDGSRNLIDAAPVALPAGAVATLVAVGNGVTQPLGFVAIPLGRLQTEAPSDNSAQGAWFNPDTVGQGVAVFTIPAQDRAFGGWYTFEPTGGAQAWFHFDSGESNAAFGQRGGPITIFRSTGGRFNAGPASTGTPVGSGTLTLTACDRATLNFTLPAPFGSGSTQLSRVATSQDCGIVNP
jgi:hypothetical protein